MTGRRPHLETLGLSVITALAGFLILDRWVVTDLGPLSFGRVWQLYINYGDFGFVRRGLVGTILQATQLPRLFGNEYYFAIFIQHLAIVGLVALTAVHFLRSRVEYGLLFKAVVFLSPTFILQSAYTTGSLDVFILAIVMANVLFVRNVVVFSALLALGIFVHELFLFTIPAQLTAYYIRNDCDLLGRFKDALKTFAAPVAVAVGVLAVVAIFGKTDLPKADFEAIMAGLIPHAVGKIELWSGYFEVGSSVSENSRSVEFLAGHLWKNLGFIAVPAAYLALLTVVLVRQESQGLRRVLLIVSVLAPLPAYLVATDFHRWIGLSANMALLLLLALTDIYGVTLRKRWLAALLAFSLLAPFGGAVIDNPFPAHKFILNRLLS